MTARKGSIKVATDDIFPIIKKWLYSEHDIFLRELVANATDAITKRSTMARTRNEEIPTAQINVEVDKKNKIIKITDNGLGMSEDEVEKYIAQLAFSGAKEFVEKLKTDETNNDKNDIIGKFGLGFYSSFMVSNKVEIESLSMEKDAKPTKWICNGETEYTFHDSNKSEIGTEITLHINKDGEEFLSGYQVSSILKKFCDFMPYPINVLDIERIKNEEKELEKAKKEGKEEKDLPTVTTQNIINDTTPLWKRDPKEIKDQEYIDFFHKMYPMDPTPLFWLHLKVDHPFTLEGILFFPKLNPNKPMNESNIKLYSKQVFVSDNVKNIISEFLSLLKGVIDSSDIPLNVSRSSLQGDPNIKKISNYVIKKVAESLKKLFKTDREKYETIWEDIGIFIKYGVISDGKFDELMRDKVIFKNSDNKYATLEEYTKSIPEQYKEKMKDKVVYFDKTSSDWSLRKQLLNEGIHAIETDDHIDPHFMQHVEAKKTGDSEIKFGAIDSEFGALLSSGNSTDEDMKIKDLFKKILVGEDKSDKDDKEEKKEDMFSSSLDVEIEKLKDSSAPAYFKVDEQMKRFKNMAKTMGQDSTFPVKKTLVLNPNNQLIKNALLISEKGANEELVEKLCHHVEDLATIASEGLKNENKEAFVVRSQSLIQELTNLAIQ